MAKRDRKSTRLNSSYTVIYTLSLHDALPISHLVRFHERIGLAGQPIAEADLVALLEECEAANGKERSEEHTSELQLHRDLHSFPTRRSSDLAFGALS